MTYTGLCQDAIRMIASTLLLATTVPLAGCDLVEVTDPTRLEERDVSTATGADLMRRNALRLLYPAAARAALGSGVLADEFFASGLIADEPLDRREPDEWLASRFYSRVPKTIYRYWHEVRHAATLAMRQLEVNSPEPQRFAYVGQMLAVRGYAALRLTEDFCPGFPLHELDGYTPIYGPPLTQEQAFERALADFDSAVVLAVDSARILDFARVGQGRALLGLGRFAAAAAAVEPVPTEFVFNGEYGRQTGQVINPLYFYRCCVGAVGFSVADREGGNGFDFVSAGDPRVPTTEYLVAQDGVTKLFQTGKYASDDAPMALASGIEARLIEAEAALATGGPWLEILNDLRTTQISPPLDPLADPGSPAARVDLFFRERAFWLFGAGSRLSDLRRLIRQYDRSSEALFPTGYHATTGLLYGTATSIPFPAELEAAYNPAVTGCTGR